MRPRYSAAVEDGALVTGAVNDESGVPCQTLIVERHRRVDVLDPYRADLTATDRIGIHHRHVVSREPE